MVNSLFVLTYTEAIYAHTMIWNGMAIIYIVGVEIMAILTHILNEKEIVIEKHKTPNVFETEIIFLWNYGKMRTFNGHALCEWFSCRLFGSWQMFHHKVSPMPNQCFGNWTTVDWDHSISQSDFANHN